MSKNKKYKELTQNTVLFALSGFGTRIISFLIVPILTYAITPTEFGTVDLLNTTVSLLIPMLTLNVQDSVLRFSLDKKISSKEVLSVAFKINLIAGIVLAVILLITQFLHIIILNRLYLIFIFLSFSLGAIGNTLTMYLKAINKVSTVVIGGLINTISYSLLSILFLFKFGWGINGYLVAIVIGVLSSVIYMFLSGEIYKDLKFNTSMDILLDMLKYSIPLVVNSMAWWLTSASDRYILTLMSGVAITGIYSAANKIPSILAVIQNIFYNAWSISAITEFEKEDRNEFIGEIYSLFSGISLLAASLIMLSNKLVTDILYADEYMQAWVFVPFLLVGTVFNGLALFEGAIFAAAKQTKEVTKTTLIGAAVNLVLNIIFIYFIGPIGAAFATMIGYISTWAVRTYYLLKIVPIKVQWRTELVSYLLIIIQAFVSIHEGTVLIQNILFIIIILVNKDSIKFYIKKFLN